MRNSPCTKFQFKLTSLFFLDQIYPKRVFSVENWKSEHHNWILHTRISLATKFQLRLAIFIFFDQIFPNEYFPSKMGKVNTTIEFYLFELVSVSNFRLNWQFWIFEPNLPKNTISGQKQRKWTTPLDCAIRINLNTQFQLKLINRIFACVHDRSFYNKLFRTGGDRHNGILMSLLLLVAETVNI